MASLPKLPLAAALLACGLAAPAAAQVFNIDTEINYPDIDSAVQAAQTLDGHTLEIREDLIAQLLPAGLNDTYPWKSITLRGDSPTRTVTGRFNFIGAGLDIRIESLVIDAVGQANPVTVGMGAQVAMENVAVANSGANGVRMMNTGGTLTWNGGSSTGNGGNGLANQGGVVVLDGVDLSNNGQHGLFAVNTGGSNSTIRNGAIANNGWAGITAAGQLPGHTIILENVDFVANNVDALEAPGAQVILNGGTFSMDGGSFSGTGNFDLYALETNGQGGSTAQFTGVSFGQAAANNILVWNNYEAEFDDCTFTTPIGAFVFNPRNGRTTVRNSTINAPAIVNYSFSTDGATPVMVIEDTVINATATGSQLVHFNNGSFAGAPDSRADNRLEIRRCQVNWNTVSAAGNMIIGTSGEHTVTLIVEDTDFVDVFTGGGGIFNNQPQTVYNLTMTGSTMKNFGNAVINNGAAPGQSIEIDQCDFISTIGRRTAILHFPGVSGSLSVVDSIFTDTALFNQSASATLTEDYNFFDARGGAGMLDPGVTPGPNSITILGSPDIFAAQYCSTDSGDPDYLGLAADSLAATLNSGNGPEAWAGAKGLLCAATSVADWAILD